MVQEQGDQAEVIRLLSDASTHGANEVQRIDTHASIVFLAGTRAFKLKRAVKYDYLDFSTPSLRKRFCEAEMRVNGRTAPALYRRVSPVVRTPTGVLALGGEGVPVDWVIEMTRFEQDDLFDRMAAAGRLPLAQMASLGDEIASFHESCLPRPEFGGAAGLARVIDGNAAGFREFGEAGLSPAVCDALTIRARGAWRRCQTLLEQRRVEGYVRECHGDLHLGNVVRFEGRPTLFDAIEFNDDIACIDVMYDLAFLLMDLWHRSLPAHANAVLNAYLARTHDLAGLAALPLFLSCRAAIRAKTTATSGPLQPTPERRQQLLTSAREYLDLAVRLLDRPPATIIAIGGLSGSGKSTMARRLAPCVGAPPGAVVVRSDEVRKRLWGASALTKLGSAAYSPAMSARVYEALIAEAAAVVAAGHSVIVDAVFARAADREAIEQAARGAGVPFAAIWLDAPEPVLTERVEQRGPDASDADGHVVRMQCAQWADDVRWARVDAVADQDSVLARVRTQLQSQMGGLEVAA